MFDLKRLEGVESSVVTELQAFITEQQSKIDQARKEAVDGRKALKAELETLRGVKDKIFEQLGIDSEDEIESALGGTRKKADESKTLEKRLQKLEAELKATQEAKAETDGKYQKTLVDAALGKAMTGIEFLDREVVEELMRGKVRLSEEGVVVMKQSDGTEIEVTEGVKAFATQKPHLVKASTTGSGSNFNPKGNGVTLKPFKEMSLSERNEVFKKDPAAYEVGMASLGK